LKPLPPQFQYISRIVRHLRVREIGLFDGVQFVRQLIYFTQPTDWTTNRPTTWSRKWLLTRLRFTSVRLTGDEIYCAFIIENFHWPEDFVADASRIAGRIVFKIYILN
jgi:hypothetical protein